MNIPHRRAPGLVFGKTAAAWIAGVIIVTASCDVLAQECSGVSQVEEQRPVAALTQVERVFWLCDYVGTTRGVDAAPVDTCVAATEELKNAKFGGDFMALLAWWQGNKPEEHARLAQLIEGSGVAGQRENDTTAYPAALSADHVKTRI